MKLFIDTANVEHIREAAKWGVLSGVTTNPSLIAKEGRKLVDVIQEIVNLVDGPISAEVQEGTAQAMVNEALPYSLIHPNIVIKIPMTWDGMAAVKELTRRGIKTNVTLVFTVQQALLAARAGATYVSPFLGRLDDFTKDPSAGYKLIQDIYHVFQTYGYSTQIIAASIRHQEHVRQSALAGAHIATIPFAVLKEMIIHPLTTKGLEIFAQDAKK